MREGGIQIIGKKREIAENERLVLFQCRRCFTVFRGIVPLGYVKMCETPRDLGPMRRELVACVRCTVYDAWPIDVFDADRASERNRFSDEKTLEYYALDDQMIEAARHRFERLEAANWHMTEPVVVAHFWASSYGVFPEGPMTEPTPDEELDYRVLQAYKLAAFQVLEAAQARHDKAEEAERAFVRKHPDKVFREISAKDWERAQSEAVENWKLIEGNAQTESWPDEI